MISAIRAFKYLTPFVMYLLGMLAFTHTGIHCWWILFFSFGFLPLAELLIRPDASNLSEAEEELAKKNILYDLLLYLAVPAQYFSLWLFLSGISDTSLTSWDITGRIAAMGILCGTFGINVAHELGHRVNPFEQFLAKSLLLTSLYMQFYIEHNRGHHKHVATPGDPSSAKYRQSVYAFWWQTVTGTWMSAWRIAIREAEKQHRRFPFFNNEMFFFQLLQVLLVIAIYYFFGLNTMLCFLAAAIMGGLLLETVQYIEHYGLSRNKKEEGMYERVKPQHSWNSNHVFGRLMLFELSRHSDHHYLASRKYQILRNLDEAPQMPTGYPGMIILSLLPPVFFRIMDKQMQKYGVLPQ